MPQKHVDHYKIHIAERSHKAKDMRVLGYTYPQIAEELGVSLQTVRNDIKRYTEELPRER
ncbi:HTH domain-containing protein, partial [Rhizobium leguminosarum]|nr:HTH domain-containing protein [Rhizobium leguminosarum]